jgi:hypothetical protein
MGKVREFWDFLDEKKTAIGGALMMAGHILGKYPQTAAAGAICEEIGMYLTGIGLAHKAVKAATPEAR